MKSNGGVGEREIPSIARPAKICFIIFILSTGITSLLSVSTPIGHPTAKWESVPISSEYYDDGGFYDVVFYNATHGWLLSVYAVLHTTDGGNSWNPILGPVTRWLYHDLSVVTPLDIWVTGGHLYHTLDGGLTWQDVYTPEIGVAKIAFYNATHGLVGDVDRVYRTIDGGITWTNSINWSSHGNMLNEFYVTASSVRVATLSGLYNSDDWGLTWSRLDSRDIRSFSFISEDEGWIAHRNTISQFTDGTIIDLPRVVGLSIPTNSYYYDVDFIDTEHGWIVGIGPAVIYTPDGGRSWYQQDCPDYALRSVDSINQTHVWAAGWRGALVKTTTGDSLGPRLIDGIIIISPFNGGGFSIPYISLIVGVTSTVGFIFLIVIRKKQRLERNMYEGPNIS